MDSAKIEKMLGLTFIVLAIASLLFMLQFTMNIALPNVLLTMVFFLLFLIAIITGILVAKGGNE